MTSDSEMAIFNFVQGCNPLADWFNASVPGLDIRQTLRGGG
jgi:hypothetical protein